MHDDPKRWRFAGPLGSDPLFLRMASHYTSFMTRRVDEALRAAEERLFDHVSHDENSQDVQALFAGMQELRSRSHDLRGKLTRALGEPLHAYCRLSQDPLASAETEQQDAESEGELRLVEDDEMAESLAWEHMTKRADSRFRIGLHALNVRLGKLAEAGELEDERNPFSPVVVCDALRSVLKGLECETVARVEIISSFDLALVRRLGLIYDTLNEQLVEAGIVPKLQWKIPRDEQDEDLPEDEQLTEEAEPEAREQQFLDGWLYGTIQWLLAERRRLQGDTRDENTPGIDRDVLTRALAAFQSELVSQQRSGLAQPVDAIKRQLIEHARELGGADTPEQLAVMDENVLDSVGLMFDFVSQDRQLPEPFQVALGKLQIPYLKAALRNPELITSSDAPAKRLLNAMAEVALGWSRSSDPSGQALGKVKKTVDRVLHEYRENDDLFEELAEDFDNFLTRQRRRAEVLERRQSEAMAGREKLTMARRNVHDLVKRAMGERQLPGLVSDILRKPWSQVMVLTLLQHGRDSEQWKRLVNVTRELVWSVSFEPQPESVQRLRTRLPVLAKALKTGLKKVGYHDEEIKKVLANLKKVYGSLVKQNGSDRIVLEQTAEGVTIRGEDIGEFAEDDHSVPTLDDEESLGEALNLVEGWHEGRWVVFHQSDEGEPVRAKLSWISPITGTYLFVDQRGRKTGEKTRAELAKELLEQRVQPLDEDDLFTRALNRVADDLKQDVGSEGAAGADHRVA